MQHSGCYQSTRCTEQRLIASFGHSRRHTASTKGQEKLARRSRIVPSAITIYITHFRVLRTQKWDCSVVMSNGRKINSAWRNDFSKFVFLRHNIEPVAVNVKAARAELGPLVAISHNKRLVTISMEFESFDESMNCECTGRRRGGGRLRSRIGKGSGHREAFL
jgi:hypothetical protein